MKLERDARVSYADYVSLLQASSLMGRSCRKGAQKKNEKARQSLPIGVLSLPLSIARNSEPSPPCEA